MVAKLTKKQKRCVRREVELELQVKPPSSTIHRNKKKYNRKEKHKKDEFLYIDLFDYMKSDTLYLLYRNVTVCYRDSYIDKLYFKSNKNTLWIDGSLVKKVTVHKPELK